MTKITNNNDEYGKNVTKSIDTSDPIQSSTSQQEISSTEASLSISSAYVLPTNANNESNSTVINIETVPYSSELPKKSIDKILNDEDHIPSNQTFVNATKEMMEEHRPASIGSLPTPIVPQKIFNIKRTQLGKDNAANSARTSAMRSALRLAAIEGLEAMNNLYDRKQPNLIRKGKFLN